MAGEHSVRQIIEPHATRIAEVALTGCVGLVETLSDGLSGLTVRAETALWPPEFTEAIIATGFVHQVLDLDLHEVSGVRETRSTTVNLRQTQAFDHDPGSRKEPNEIS